MRARPRLTELLLLSAIPLTLAACGGGTSRSALLERYECTQTRNLAAFANGAASDRFAWDGVHLDAQVASLRLPGLRPVPLAAENGLPRPWRAMSTAQRDTFAAWQAVDGSAVIGDVRSRQGIFPPDPVKKCARPSLPSAASGGGGFARTIDIVVRGNGSGEALDAVLKQLDASRLAQLEQSAFTGPTWLAYDGDGDGLLGSSTPSGVRFSTAQLYAVLLAFAHDTPRWKQFLARLARVQAGQIAAHVIGPKTDTAWAGEIGAIDGIVAAAALHSGKHGQAPAAALADAVVAELDRPGSGRAQLDRSLPDVPIDVGLFRTSYTLALAAGYATAAGESPPAGLVRAGQVSPPDDLTPIARARLDDWIGNRLEGTVPALRVADYGFDDRVVGCCSAPR